MSFWKYLILRIPELVGMSAAMLGLYIMNCLVIEDAVLDELLNPPIVPICLAVSLLCAFAQHYLYRKFEV